MSSISSVGNTSVYLTQAANKNQSKPNSPAQASATNKPSQPTGNDSDHDGDSDSGGIDIKA